MGVLEEARRLAPAMVEVRRKYPERGIGKGAALVGNLASFGLSRMHQTLSEDLPQDIRVFDDFDEAVTWLAESD